MKFYNLHRIIILFATVVFLVIFNEIRDKYRSVCYPDLNPTDCTETFRSYIHSPLTSTYNEILILLFILFLLPAHYVRSWVLYIGSWSVPLAIWFIATTKDTPGVITWANTPSSAALLAINTLIILTIVYALVRFSWNYWHKQTPK